MTQAKHTPGPWNQGADIRQIGAGNGIIVCNVSGAISNASVIADARLIAAAPELLEACEQGLIALCCIPDNPSFGDLEGLRNFMRATIAKATGASND